MKTVKTVVIVSILAIICILCVMMISNKVEEQTPDVAQPINVIPYKNESTNWHTVLCIDEEGNAESYEIPVPNLEGFTPEFKKAYLEYAGRQFCDSIIDKTEYVIDVGEDDK